MQCSLVALSAASVCLSPIMALSAQACSDPLVPSFVPEIPIQPLTLLHDRRLNNPRTDGKGPFAVIESGRGRESERAGQRSHPSPRLASIDQIHCNKINHGSERNATPVAKHSRSRQNESRLADGHGTNTLVSECLTRRPSEDLMRSLPRSHGTGEKDFPSQGPGRTSQARRIRHRRPRAREGLGLVLLLCTRPTLARNAAIRRSRPPRGCPMRF